MTTAEKTAITVEATVHAPVEKVWKFWTNPKHIVKWNSASDDWHTPHAENDVRTGGKFLSRMEAKDGSSGFDFKGEYTLVQTNKRIEYTMEDGRKVWIRFETNGSSTTITEIFEAEQMNSIELQRDGWQAIMNNFKKYIEDSIRMEKIHFEVEINAPASKVFTRMLDDLYYRQWTVEFNPTSYFEGSWEKGSKILFIGTDDKGNTGGMVSRIKENIPSKFVSIQHYGVLNNGVEITSGPEVDGWAGSEENYTFTEKNGKTLVAVDVDINQEYKGMFEEMWPKALKKLKEVCEEG